MTTKPSPTTATMPAPAQGGDERSESPTEEGAGGAVRGRPGRRTLAERHDAVLQVLMGKASIDQVAARMGVHPATVEQWRDQALAGMTEALLRGDAATPRERELERTVDQLTESLKDISVRYALAQQAVDKLVAPMGNSQARPTRPARSRRR
jgi:transposase-like protein